MHWMKRIELAVTFTRGRRFPFLSTIYFAVVSLLLPLLSLSYRTLSPLVTFQRDTFHESRWSLMIREIFASCVTNFQWANICQGIFLNFHEYLWWTFWYCLFMRTFVSFNWILRRKDNVLANLSVRWSNDRWQFFWQFTLYPVINIFSTLWHLLIILSSLVLRERFFHKSSLPEFSLYSGNPFPLLSSFLIFLRLTLWFGQERVNLCSLLLDF